MSFISVCGPPGVGKTTLVSTLVRQLGWDSAGAARKEIGKVAPSLWSNRTKDRPLRELIRDYRRATRLAFDLNRVFRGAGPVVLDRGPEDLEFQISCRESWTGAHSRLPSALSSEAGTLRAIRSDWVLYPDAPDAVLWERISHDPERRRPLDADRFGALHRRERLFYDRLPGVFILETDGRPPEKVVGSAITLLKNIGLIPS